MLDPERARKALRENDPAALLGLPERQWLDAKAAAYEPRNPRAVEELAKDVAGFANRGGGLIVMGIRTRLVDGEEVLDRVESLDRAAVSLDTLRKLIRDHITPAPRAVAVEWSDTGQGECVAFIDIAAQAADCVFVVAAPVGKHGTESTTTVAVPMREADGTHWLPRAEIQRLLSAGVAASGMPTSQALASLVHQAVSAIPPQPPAVRVGQGAGDREREVREAYERLSAAGLGLPAGEAHLHGPAVLQDFHAAREGDPGWVLCLVRGRAPVAVSVPVWQALVDAGLPHPGDDPLAAVGYPAAAGDSGAADVLDGERQRVEISGGRSGPGLLLRSGRGVWRWEPAVVFGLNQTRVAENWTSHPLPQLRVRAVLTLPYADGHTLEITRTRRRDLEQRLPYSALAGAATFLSRRRGAELPAEHWAMGPFDNRPLSASYTSYLTAPDGRTALTAAAMIALPGATQPNTVTCAEVLIQDADAWAATLPHGADTRLGLDEVQHTLLAAWETAAELMPDTIGDPSGRQWAGPPTCELLLIAHGPDGQPSPGLDALIDMTPLGARDRENLPEMAIKITAPPAMERGQRKILLRRALAHTAQHFGYLWADEEAFS